MSATLHPSESIAGPGSHARGGIAFLTLGIALGLLLILGRTAIYGLEGSVSSVATLLPLGYAFAAGMVATVNPCGVLLLPSLVAYYLGQGEAAGATGWTRAGRALELGAWATVGFVALFAVVGFLVGAGGHALGRAFPLGGLAIGILLTALGAWLTLTGQGFGLLLASQSMGRVQLGTSWRSMFAFGIAYAIASLACTLPVFLVVVGAALAMDGIVAAAFDFISYALGMGVVLTAVILGAAFFQGFVARWIRRIAPYVHRLSACFLLGAGLFLIHYWLTTGRALG